MTASTDARAATRDKMIRSDVTFQHRHFAIIADAVKRRFTNAPATPNMAGYVMEHGVHRWTALEVAEILAAELGATNPKFNSKRFLSACGFEE